jgi:hypothetical protein
MLITISILPLQNKQNLEKRIAMKHFTSDHYAQKVLQIESKKKIFYDQTTNHYVSILQTMRGRERRVPATIADHISVIIHYCRA